MNEKLIDPEIQLAAEHLIGSYGWLLIIAFLGILFKDAIHKAAEGLFYMTDRGTKMIVPNDRLKLLVIEKKLPLNGGFHYLHKGGEKGYEEQRAIRDKMKEHPNIEKNVGKG